MTKLNIQKTILNKLYTLAIKHPDKKRVSINPQTKIDKQYNQPQSSTNQYQKDQLLNQAVEELAKKLFVKLEHIKFSNGMYSNNYKAIIINRDKLTEIKKWLITNHITPLDLDIANHQHELNELSRTIKQSPITNHLIQNLHDDLQNFKIKKTWDKDLALIKTIAALPADNSNKIYSRELSQYTFHDTKSLEKSSKIGHTQYRGKLETILKQYDDSLENHGIIETDKEQSIFQLYSPSKCLIIDNIPTNEFSLTHYEPIMIHTDAKYIISVENQTAFQRLKSATNLPNNLILTYTGGQAAIDFKKLYANFINQNPQLQLFHFGDLDLAGFRILKNLDHTMYEQTHHHVKSWFMNEDTFNKFKSYGQLLTKQTQINQLTKLIEKHDPYSNLYQLFLDNNRTIEQELIAYWITTLPISDIQASFD